MVWVKPSPIPWRPGAKKPIPLPGGGVRPQQRLGPHLFNDEVGDDLVHLLSCSCQGAA